MASQQGMEPALREHCRHVALGQCLCGQAAATRQLVYTAECHAHHEDLHNDMKAHGHYCIPIQTEDELLGVLTLYLSPRHHRTEIEEHFITMAADMLALVIRHVRAPALSWSWLIGHFGGEVKVYSTA